MNLIVKKLRVPKSVLAIGAVAFAAFGARIGIPGVDTDVLRDFFIRQGGGGLLGLYNWLVGGAISRGAILALGIIPYLSAALWLRLAAVVSPRVAELEPHRAQRWTRVLTTAFSLAQSYGFAVFVQKIPGAVADPGPAFVARTMLTLTAGALSAMWLTERLTERGAEDDAPVAETAEKPIPPLRFAQGRDDNQGVLGERLLTPGEISFAHQQSRPKEHVKVD